ncbi:adenine phosphoribosyltransferase [Spiroplasma endosymbiont of Labia minor]|uniref:adenine phosphoribosyltransferase n=1 Tax=Spiroplasma endosymbiont of Labia minor TaxID=3066305 RepID=UPI0030CC2EA6
MDLSKFIIDVPNFPSSGVIFKDITPLLEDAQAFKYTIEQMVQFAKEVGATVVVAPEARGFLFASAVCFAAGLRFVIARKPNKLPRETFKAVYELEYGENALEINRDAIKQNDRVLIVDDILATGGTAKAIVELVEKSNATVVGAVFLGELKEIYKNDVLKDIKIKSLLTF